MYQFKCNNFKNSFELTVWWICLSHWWNWGLIRLMEDEACHCRIGIHVITIWIIWGTSANSTCTLFSLHTSLPPQFFIWLGVELRMWVEGQEGLEISYVVCDIFHWQSLVWEIVFLLFPDFLVTKDRAGIQGCFILCCCSGIMPLGSWTFQPAWNQTVKWLISFWAPLFQFSSTNISFSIFPRA